jgi:hypothetical protein
MERKTRKEWFETLPEPYNVEAIRNTKQIALNNVCHSLKEAIYCGFVWSESKEGLEYWADFVEKFIDIKK